jgi:hypothetical protein
MPVDLIFTFVICTPPSETKKVHSVVAETLHSLHLLGCGLNNWAALIQFPAEARHFPLIQNA